MNDYDKYNDKYLKYKNKYLELKQYAGSPLPKPTHQKLIYFCNKNFIEKLCPSLDNTMSLKEIEKTLYTDCTKERRNIAFVAKNDTPYLKIIYKPESFINWRWSRIPKLTDGLNLYDIIRNLKTDTKKILDTYRHQNLTYYSTPNDFQTLTSDATSAISTLIKTDYTYVPPIDVPIDSNFIVPTKKEEITNIKLMNTLQNFDSELFKNVIKYIQLYMGYFHPTFDKIDSCFIVNTNTEDMPNMEKNQCVFQQIFKDSDFKYI